MTLRPKVQKYLPVFISTWIPGFGKDAVRTALRTGKFTASDGGKGRTFDLSPKDRRQLLFELERTGQL